MGITEDKIRDLLEQVLTPPLALFSLQVQNRKNHALIEIDLDHLTDRTGSASLEDCEMVSRRLKEEMDTWGEEFDFTLQVSSAGAERELRLPGDLVRFQGLLAKLEISLDGTTWEKKVFRLGASNGNAVELLPFERKKPQKRNPKPITLNFDSIRKGNLYLEV